MRRGLAAAALSAAAALVLGAPAATAGPNGPVVSDGTVSVAMSPGNTNPPLLAGHFHVDDPNAAMTVAVTMAWKGPDPDHHPKFDPQTVCPGAQCANDGNGNYDIAGFKLPAAVYNGPYHLDATATARDFLNRTGSQPVATDFSVAVAPPSVMNVTATVDSKREVTLSWDRDPTTPDVGAYYIWRKGPGDKDFGKQAISQTPQQSTGARIIVPDADSSTVNKGGAYQYQIETRRNGGDGLYSPTDFVASDKTKSQSNLVNVPNPPPGATTIPTPPQGNGPPPVVKGTPSGVNRNSGFSGSGSSAATTPTSEAVTPDPGFVRGLPYAGSNPKDANGEGDNSAVAVTPGSHKSNGKGYLVPVAGGAVLFLGALHLRMFKKRLDEPPSTSLTPV